MNNTGCGRTDYDKGVRIEIVNNPVKINNGIFEITGLFPMQSNGDEYFQYRRVMKNGNLSDNHKNLRGAWGSTLDKIATIVKCK